MSRGFWSLPPRYGDAMALFSAIIWVPGRLSHSRRSGRSAAISSSVLKSYSYDAASSITALDDNANSALNWSYSYDALDRVSGAGTSGQSSVYTYDANGNRLTQSGTANALYSVGAANNQLATVVGGLSRTCSYDASGNVTGNGVLALTYNAAGRIVTANNGTITTSYIYNALGQRVEKSNANSTTYFVYDGAGHLIGEYDAGGNLIQEVVWPQALRYR
jgi:YD repeat-containing protein